MDLEEPERGCSGVMTGFVSTSVRASEGQRTIPLPRLSASRVWVLRQSGEIVVEARGSVTGSGGHRSPQVPWHRPIFNTEETKNPRSSKGRQYCASCKVPEI